MYAPHTTVWLLKNYSQRILTYRTRILLLDLTYGRTMTDIGNMHKNLVKIARVVTEIYALSLG